MDEKSKGVVSLCGLIHTPYVILYTPYTHSLCDLIHTLYTLLMWSYTWSYTHSLCGLIHGLIHTPYVVLYMVLYTLLMWSYTWSYTHSLCGLIHTLYTLLIHNTSFSHLINNFHLTSRLLDSKEILNVLSSSNPADFSTTASKITTKL